MLNIVSKTRPEVKVIVLDDANYLLSNETFQNALTKGWTHALTNLTAGSLKAI